MSFINYICYCVSTFFSYAFGNGSYGNGSVLDAFVGFITFLVIIGILIFIIKLTHLILKKKQSKKIDNADKIDNVNRKDYIQVPFNINNSPLTSSKERTQEGFKSNGKDYIQK